MEKIILEGVPVYTSDELKEKLKSLIRRKIKISSETKDILLSLIDMGILTPIINKQNFIQKLIMKLKGITPISPYIGGVAYSKHKKIYVIFSSNLTSKRIMDATLHEAVHYAYIQSPSNFISSNKKLLEEFYLTFFKLYFDTENYDKNAFKIVLDKIFNPSTVYYNTYYELIPNAFRSYSNIKNDKILKERVVNLWKYVYNAIEASEVFENTTIQKYMRATYKIMFNAVDYGSIHGQELYLPDEIISVLSTINPNHPNVIKSLKLIVPGKSTMIKNRLKRIIK